MTGMTKTDGGQRLPLWRVAMWGGIATLLLLPAVAMQFTREVAWGPEDFTFAGIVLIGAGGLYELAAWKLRSLTARLIAAAVILGAVLLIWGGAVAGVI